MGSTPGHTYVCEYRVDRAARLFTKVARARHQVCTKPYAFETFPQRIKHYRTYLVSSSSVCGDILETNEEEEMEGKTVVKCYSLTVWKGYKSQVK